MVGAGSRADRGNVEDHDVGVAWVRGIATFQLCVCLAIGLHQGIKLVVLHIDRHACNDAAERDQSVGRAGRNRASGGCGRRVG